MTRRRDERPSGMIINPNALKINKERESDRGEAADGRWNLCSEAHINICIYINGELCRLRRKRSKEKRPDLTRFDQIEVCYGEVGANFLGNVMLISLLKCVSCLIQAYVHACMYVGMHVWHGWMDGWMDG
jgi:hypothetical protein